MSEHRWSVYLDIEGFSKRYEAEGSYEILKHLKETLDDVDKIAVKYNSSPNRIFTHQIGDSFFIVSEFDAQSLDVPLSIAIALMKSAIVRGYALRAAVSEGNNMDIGHDNTAKSVMSVTRIMGTAYIKAVNLCGRNGLKGPLLFVDKTLSNMISTIKKIYYCSWKDFIEVDWVNSRTELSLELLRIFLDKDFYDGIENDIQGRLSEYIKKHDKDLPAEWRRNAIGLIKGVVTNS